MNRFPPEHESRGIQKCFNFYRTLISLANIGLLNFGVLMFLIKNVSDIGKIEDVAESGGVLGIRNTICNSNTFKYNSTF